MTRTRTLHELEVKLLNILREYEVAVEKRQLSFAIIVNAVGLTALRRAEEDYKLFKTIEIKEVPLVAGGTGFQVIFSVPEFEKYLHFFLNQAGIAYLPNSKLCFPDGYTIEVASHVDSNAISH